VLAKVTLPKSSATSIAEPNIDNTVRRIIVSTAVLQEQVITCCCDQSTQTPPSSKLLEVNNVRILHVHNPQLPADSPDKTLIDMRERNLDPTQPIKEVPALATNGIEIEFINATLDVNSVIAGTTFKVEDSTGAVVPGNIFPSQATNTVRWVGQNPPGDTFNLQGISQYKLTLVGGTSPPAITSTEGLRLDGEPNKQFPSGNGMEGGDFVLLLITGDVTF
jgi:hypothetical protein